MTTHADFTKLWELIADIQFGMLTLRHDDGTLRSRPMTTQNRKDDRGDVLWFFASKRGEPALDIGDGADVNVAYADPGKDAYVSIAGTARIVDDRQKKKELWNTIAKSWFPGGVDDPDLTLIAISIRHAEYWDVKASHVTQLVQMAAAALTGRQARLEVDHGEVRRP